MSGVIVVPVHLDALCLTNDLDVLGPTADFTRLPYRDPETGTDQNPDLPYVSEIMLPSAFQDQDFRLKAGVHLHWALPDALTRMVQGDDGATTIPAVPNRWLVTRSNNGKIEDEWVIESDLLSEDNAAAVGYPVTGAGRPYLGLGGKTPLNVWNPKTTKSAAHLPKLTAVGYGEPTFAALYANCHSVFGFHDPTYQGVPPDGVGYDVVGWYDDVTQDPIAALSKARKPGAPAWQDVCRERFGWSVTGQVPKSPPDRLACFARLTFGATARATADTDSETGVCVGSTATEALAAHLGSVLDGTTPDQVEDLLEALTFADELEAKPLDLGAKLQESRHAATFQDVPGGTRWIIRRQDESQGVTAQEQQLREQLAVPHQVSDLLNLLNAAQADVDRIEQELVTLREQLFADWYKYQLCAYPYDSLRDSYPDQDEVQFFLRRTMRFLAGESERGTRATDRLAQARATVDTALAELNDQLRPARSTYSVTETPAPPYQVPGEPVVLLTGTAATPGDRHGQDGALHPDGLLTCAVSPVNGTDLGSPSRLRTLRLEAAKVITALPAPGFAVGVWREPPWHPVLLEWEVEFFPATLGNNLDPQDRDYRDDFITTNYALAPQEMELQPLLDVPDKAADVYAGTTILSPGARPVLSARVLRYLQGTVLAAYDATDEPTVTADAFLADPATVLTWFDTHGDDQRLTLLVKIYRHLAEHEDSNLSAVLGGFNDALLMRKLTRQLPIGDPLGFPAYQDFAAEVAAAVGGQTRHAPQPLSDFNPIRAGALRVLRLRIVDNFGIALDVDVNQIQTTTQLRVSGHPDWVAMPPRLAQPTRLSFGWLDAEDDIQQMNGLPDTSPICGWLVPDNLDGGLATYAADGSAIGGLYAAGGTVQWRPPPGGAATTPIDAIGNVHLRAVVRRLYDSGAAALSGMLADLEDTLQQIEPEDYAQHRGRAVLMGQPLAVVRAEVALELMGWPAVHQDWNVFRQDMRRSSRETNEFPLVRFPVRIGEQSRLNDGVVGFWLEDAAQHLAADFHSVRHNDNPLVQAIDMPAQYLTMLVDPRGDVHATSGILPTRTLQIPPEMFRAALEGMAVSFFTAPLLTDPDHFAVPLPDEPGYAWTWQEQHRTGWAEQADPPQPDSRILDQPTLREGWLTLRPVPGQNTDQGAE